MQTLHVISLDPNQPVDKYASPDKAKQIIRYREERILSIVRQAKIQGFALAIQEGDLTDEVFRCKNISRAFKKIVQYAKEERLASVTIAEDDVLFTSTNSWRYYLENIPDDYDLYLGGIYAGRLDGNRIVDGYSGNTLVTVHERFYDFFLQVDPDDHLDRALGKFCAEKKYIVSLPFVCKQIGGYSENKKKFITTEYSMYEQDWEYLK